MEVLDTSIWKKTLSLWPKNALELFFIDLTMDTQMMDIFMDGWIY